MRTPLLTTALVLASLASPAVPQALAPGFERGIVFGAGEWSAPGAAYDSPSALAALAALAATGATHVRFLATAFQDSVDSTQLYGIQPPSALASESLPSLRAAFAAARGLNLSIVLCAVVDPSWDNTSNVRASGSPGTVWRGMVGRRFSPSDWAAWFSSFRAYFMPYFAAAAEAGAHTLQLASEMDFAFAAAPQAWAALAAEVRALCPASTRLSIAVNAHTAAALTWLGALDAVGLDLYTSLGAPLPLGQAPAVADLGAAYAAAVLPALEALWARNLTLYISETGFQSRPNCHVRPSGTAPLDAYDDSSWPVTVDTACQANAYEALFRFAASQPRLTGAYLWLWRTDATTGGTCDDDFTPFAKPAEAVLRRWYGGDPAGSGTAALLAARVRALGQPSPQQRARALAAVAPPAPRAYSGPRSRGLLPPHPRTRRTFNGFCSGSGSEWSSPFYAADSAGALASLDAMVAQTGADSVEVIAQWFFDNVTDTEIYPVTDPASPLRTPTDGELGALVAAARARGLKTIFSLMLDPNWLLPAQMGCRGNHTPPCYARGAIGVLWPDDCAPGSAWAAWHENYARATLHYAALAAAWGVDAFLLAHELAVPNLHCPALWAQLLARVRGVYAGRVSSVLYFESSAANSPWVAGLDFLSVDCYFTAPLPHSLVPALPWQDVTLEQLVAAEAALMPPLANFSQRFSKPIVCTEIGMPSRPWAYTGWGNTRMLDGEDCSVSDQCISVAAQALAYTAWLQVYYAQPWFDGFLFWIWKADPTAGGLSSNSFSPQGKPPVLNEIKALWGV